MQELLTWIITQKKDIHKEAVLRGLPLRVMGNSIFYFLPDRVLLLFHHK